MKFRQFKEEEKVNRRCAYSNKGTLFQMKNLV
jgi:hypothetical protein